MEIRSSHFQVQLFQEGSKTVTSEDSDSDLDLSKDLFSIGGYIKDRPEMMEQMFQAVRGPSLRRALPDILLVSTGIHGSSPFPFIFTSPQNNQIP